MDSMPASSAGRPELTAPNATSRLPVSLPSRTAQQPCMTVFSVRPRARAHDDSRCVTSSGRSTTSDSGMTDTRSRSAGPSLLASPKPSKAARHAVRAASSSCAPSHAR